MYKNILIMNKISLPIICLFVLYLSISCTNKTYTEVVEVPLPAPTEKVLMGVPEDVQAADGAFQLEKLPYSYGALAPHISAFTMENHYSKHYLAYTNNLNKALVGTALENLTIEEVLTKLDPAVPEIKNNAGGYYNHSLFYKCMASKAGGQPQDTLAGAITKKFGSFGNFTSLFKDQAAKQFGSGWVWLIVDRSGDLQVATTQNQDNPLMKNATVMGKPILALDLWEHAYYLDYQFKRQNYINAFFNVINWKKVSENYQEAIKE
jgi:Fe-Mn family superoxide dismutase